MINGRFQSLDKEERSKLRYEQKITQMAKSPNYGNGKHIEGNKHPGKFRGGHHFNKAIR